MYVLVRTDLSLPQQLVQALHAAHDAAVAFGKPGTTPHLALLAVPNESSLRTAAARSVAAGVSCSEFREPDMNNALTAIATEAISGTKRKVFSKYPLWKGVGHEVR